MTSPIRRTRQYRVTHIPTGIVTVVQHADDGNYAGVAQRAGLRYAFDAEVSVIPRGQEIPLAFDCIPLVLRPRVA